jgi:hypothetical protein
VRSIASSGRSMTRSKGRAGGERRIGNESGRRLSTPASVFGTPEKPSERC